MMERYSAKLSIGVVLPFAVWAAVFRLNGEFISKFYEFKNKVFPNGKRFQSEK